MTKKEQNLSFRPNIYTLAIAIVFCGTTIYISTLFFNNAKTTSPKLNKTGQQEDIQVSGGPVTQNESSNNQTVAFYDESLPFQIPLEETVNLREDVKKRIVERKNFDLRDIYEEYFLKVGANGLLTAVMEEYPGCHDRGHDLGKVIYAKSGQIGESLRICSDSCYSGCMHGVLMEAFSQEDPEPHEHTEDELKNGHLHTTLEDVEKQMDKICNDDEVLAEYSRGDCLHGVGHALMYLSNYDPGQAIEYCNLFPTNPERYYCATGAYMEYVTQNWVADRQAGKTTFYPCDENEYPAACYRYLFGYTFYDHYKKEKPTIDIINGCLEMDRHQRLGCFHGIGNAHIGEIIYGYVSFEELCSYGNKDDQYMCIEGAIERMARYHPAEALEACKQLSGWQYEHCEVGRANQLYNMEKSFELYLLD